MLVLSRKSGQSIQLGEDIEIIVTKISKGRVRIGIEAPSATHVRRAELTSRSLAEVTSRSLKDNYPMLHRTAK